MDGLRVVFGTLLVKCEGSISPQIYIGFGDTEFREDVWRRGRNIT